MKSQEITCPCGSRVLLRPGTGLLPGKTQQGDIMFFECKACGGEYARPFTQAEKQERTKELAQQEAEAEKKRSAWWQQR